MTNLLPALIVPGIIERWMFQPSTLAGIWVNNGRIAQPLRCCCLDVRGNQCDKDAHQLETIHEDAEHRGQRWVIVAVCKEHRTQRPKGNQQ